MNNSIDLSMLQMKSGKKDSYFCKSDDDDDVFLKEKVMKNYCCWYFHHHFYYHKFSHKKGIGKVWLLESACKEALTLLALTLVLQPPFATSCFLLSDCHNTSSIHHNLTQFVLALSCASNYISYNLFN
ncbi:hypothetical protein V8G54_036594 [Vigna mungo]|uniref:Uncharacterized protein n=1 Tax=Vigna mungo TaxID=3915 RepID=A0AAQ3MHK2_VIGMU